MARHWNPPFFSMLPRGWNKLRRRNGGYVGCDVRGFGTWRDVAGCAGLLSRPSSIFPAELPASCPSSLQYPFYYFFPHLFCGFFVAKLAVWIILESWSGKSRTWRRLKWIVWCDYCFLKQMATGIMGWPWRGRCCKVASTSHISIALVIFALRPGTVQSGAKLDFIIPVSLLDRPLSPRQRVF